MKTILISVGLAIALLTVIGLLSPKGTNSPAKPEHIAQQREEMKQRMAATAFKSPPILECAAQRVGVDTVETTYLVWINKRGDLTTKSQRDSASLDSINSIQACGGDMTALIREMEESGDTVNKGLALAMLQANR